jgi:hypothetical protein
MNKLSFKTFYVTSLPLYISLINSKMNKDYKTKDILTTQLTQKWVIFTFVGRETTFIENFSNLPI